MNETTHDGNHETLIWLDYSLRWARAGDHAKLAWLLEQVRTEIMFEVELAEAAAKSTLEESSG
ncbi:MAG: hypothetical protein ACRDSJ_02610 [Rubrobacteraceae bacterium]